MSEQETFHLHELRDPQKSNIPLNVPSTPDASLLHRACLVYLDRQYVLDSQMRLIRCKTFKHELPYWHPISKGWEINSGHYIAILGRRYLQNYIHMYLYCIVLKIIYIYDINKYSTNLISVCTVVFTEEKIGLT